jgi:hypothetical protein
LSGWPSASKDSKENRLECSFDGGEIGSTGVVVKWSLPDDRV